MSPSRRRPAVRLLAATTILLLAGANSRAVGQPPSAQKSDALALCGTKSGDGRCRHFPKARSIEEAFFHFQLALGALNERVASEPGISLGSAAHVQDQVSELQGLFHRAIGPASDPDYIASLNYLAEATIVAAGQRDPSKVNSALTALGADLRVKVASARASLGAQGRAPGKIRVVVTTKRGNRGASGYFIKAAAALHASHPPTYSFTNPTSPATQTDLPPGLYVLIAYKGAKQVARQDAEVGLSSRDSAHLIMLVP